MIRTHCPAYRVAPLFSDWNYTLTHRHYQNGGTANLIMHGGEGRTGKEVGMVYFKAQP
jgi:hypothetical protein